MIKQNTINDDILVLDRGNECVYIFNKEGKYIRKIGSPGQGPGDLLGARYFNITKDGEIYIYEDINVRFSIFSTNTGKYINSFRKDISSGIFNFIFYQSDKILSFENGSGYYITVRAKDGTLLNRLGEIKKYNKIQYINNLYLTGFICADKDKYIFVFESFPIIREYNVNGQLILEKIIDKQLEVNLKEYPDPSKYTEESIRSVKKQFNVYIIKIINYTC